LAGSPSQNLETFLPEAEAAFPEDWITFEVDGKVIRADRPLRGDSDKLTTKPADLLVRFSQLDADYLEIAYINESVQKGVHTVLEMYRPLKGEELTKMLQTSYDLKECPTNDAEEAAKKAIPEVQAKLEKMKALRKPDERGQTPPPPVEAPPASKPL
jgi:hypothetical protein